MKQRFDFAFDPLYRVAALPFLIAPQTAWVELTPTELRVRFGPWRLTTAVANIARAEVTGGYHFIRTAGPPHLSLSDLGVSFATNGDAGACLHFDRPVKALDPTGVLRHPGATLTVADVDGLLDSLRDRGVAV